jgi:thioredoxin-like negative regulator of GroEL
VWVERLGRGSELEHDVAVERAHHRADGGDVDGALRLLGSVPKGSRAAPAARSAEALVLAGADRCSAATPRLRALLATPSEPAVDDAHRVALARCLLDAGRHDEARALAGDVDRLGATADEAAWIDGAAAAAAPQGPPPEEPLWRKVAEASGETRDWLEGARKRLAVLGGR